MRIQTDKYGNQAFLYDSITERRAMVTGLILADSENGILTSQRAKYERQHWAFVCGLLPGTDKRGPVTCIEMSLTLARQNIIIKPNALYRSIQSMIHLQDSIHPHRRAIGVSCFEVVTAMGGVRFVTIPAADNRIGYDIDAYYFNKPHDEVIRLRRAYKLIVQANP